MSIFNSSDIHQLSQENIEKYVLVKTKELNETCYPEKMLPFQEELILVTENALKRQDLMSANLATELGRHLTEIGKAAEGLKYIQQALAIRENLLGKEHLSTATSLHNLAYVLYHMEETNKAKLKLQKALRIREKLNAKETIIAENYNDLGMIFERLGKIRKAWYFYDQALTIREVHLGVEHELTGMSFNNLACILCAIGELEQAKQHLEQALATLQRKLGTNHPWTKIAMENIKKVKERLDKRG